MFRFNGPPPFMNMHQERPWCEVPRPQYNYYQNFNPYWRPPFFLNGPMMPSSHHGYYGNNFEMQRHNEGPRNFSNENMMNKRLHEEPQQRKYNTPFKQVRALDKSDNKNGEDKKENIDTSDSKEENSGVKNDGTEDNEKRHVASLSENKNIVTDSENKNIVTDSENKNIVIDSENKNIVTDSENKNIVTDSENKNIVTDSENKNIVIDSENKNIVTDSENKNIVTDSGNKEKDAVGNKDTAQESISEDNNDSVTQSSTVELDDNKKRVERSLSESKSKCTDNENKARISSIEPVDNKKKTEKSLSESKNKVEKESKTNSTVQENHKRVEKSLDESKNTAVNSEIKSKNSAVELVNNEAKKYVTENKGTETNVDKVKLVDSDRKIPKEFVMGNGNYVSTSETKSENIAVACNDKKAEECLTNVKKNSANESKFKNSAFEYNNKINGKLSRGKIKISLLCNREKSDSSKAKISTTTTDECLKNGNLKVSGMNSAGNTFKDSVKDSDKDCNNGIKYTNSSPIVITSGESSPTENEIFDDCFTVDNQKSRRNQIETRGNDNSGKHILEVENHFKSSSSSHNGFNTTSEKILGKRRSSLNLQTTNKTSYSPTNKSHGNDNYKSPTSTSSKHLLDDTSYASRMKKLKLTPEDLRPKSDKIIPRNYSTCVRNIPFENKTDESNKIDVICERNRRHGTDRARSTGPGSCLSDCISPDTAPVVNFKMQIPLNTICIRRLSPHVTENDISRALQSLGFKAQHISLFRLNTGSSGGHGSIVFKKLLEAAEFIKKCEGVLVLECQCKALLQFADDTQWLCECKTLNACSTTNCTECNMSKYFKDSDLTHISTCDLSTPTPSHAQYLSSAEDSHHSEYTTRKKRCLRKVSGTLRTSSDSDISSLSPAPSFPIFSSIEPIQKPEVNSPSPGRCSATVINSGLPRLPSSSPISSRNVEQNFDNIKNNTTDEVSFSFNNQNGLIVEGTRSPKFDITKRYSPPDKDKFTYDESIGYYYDPATGLYFNEETGLYLNSKAQQQLYWNAVQCMYVPVCGEKDEAAEKTTKLRTLNVSMKRHKSKPSSVNSSIIIEELDDWKCCMREAEYLTEKLQKWSDNFKICNDNGQYNKEEADVELLLLKTKSIVELGLAVMYGEELQSESCIGYVKSLMNNPQTSHQMSSVSSILDSDPHVDMKTKSCRICNLQFETPIQLIWHIRYSVHHTALAYT